MAVTAHVFTKQLLALGSKLENIGTDALKVMLLSAYTPGQDTHEFVSDVVGAGTEAVGTGYTAGGQALSSVTFTASGHVYTLSSANPSWSASGGALSAAFAVFYDSTPGSNATNPVIAYWDFGGTLTATNAAFGLTISGSGIVTFTGS